MAILKAGLFAGGLVSMAFAPAHALDCTVLPARCAGVTAADHPAPLWSVPLTGPQATATRIVIEGHGQGPDFVPKAARALIDEAAPSAMPALPIDASLLGWMTAAPFGREERAMVKRTKDSLMLSCRAGEAPAGLVFSGPARLPQDAQLRLQWRAANAGDFKIGLAFAEQEPRHFASLAAGEGTVAIDAGSSSQEEARITIACPPAGGRLVLADLRLLPQGEPTLAKRSAWAWRSSLWRDNPRQLMGDAAALDVRRLFVSIDVDPEGGLQNADRFAGFVRQAHASGLEIVVVEGDAGMAMPEGRAHALARLAAILAYQRQVEPVAQIDGLQYDIEPYLLPEFMTDPERVMRGWADTILAIRNAAALDVEMVLPFWLAADGNAVRHVLPALEASRSRIAIMAYRTSVHAIESAAEPLLAWSSRVGLAARVALEAGPLPDETTRTFLKAPEGALAVEQDQDGSFRAVLYAASSEAMPKGRRFRFSHERVSPAAAVSFLGDRPRILSTAGRLQQIFRAWPSFAGLSLHGMIP